jgi:hypothetical protein
MGFVDERYATMIATSFGLSFAVNVNAGTARCHHGI